MFLTTMTKLAVVSIVVAGLTVIYNLRLRYLILTKTKELQTSNVQLLKEIADRRRAEESISQNEKRFRLLYDNAPIAYQSLDNEGCIIEVNRAWLDLLGYNRREVKGRNFMELLVPEDQERFGKSYTRFKTSGKISGVEFTMVCKDGSQVMVNLDGRVAVDDQNNFLQTHCVLNDITLQKQAEMEVSQSLAKLKLTIESTIEAMARIVEIRDPYTAGHQQRVALLAAAIAGEMGFSETDINGLRWAAVIHDIGKINVPAEILSKPGHLSEIEHQIIQTHPQLSYEILKTIDFPWPVALIALQHHERIDGTGYPDRLVGESIMLEARILAVADVVEAMVSHRPYRPALGLEMAIAEISETSWRHYMTPLLSMSASAS